MATLLDEPLTLERTAVEEPTAVQEVEQARHADQFAEIGMNVALEMLSVDSQTFLEVAKQEQGE